MVRVLKESPFHFILKKMHLFVRYLINSKASLAGLDIFVTLYNVQIQRKAISM